MFESIFPARTSPSNNLFFNEPDSYTTLTSDAELGKKNIIAEQQIADLPKANIVTFFNYKGGTGKTTSCISVAGRLAQLGKRVLVVDWDAQSNATLALGVDPARVQRSMSDVVFEQLDNSDSDSIKKIILKTKFANLDLAPAKLNLSVAESALVERSASPDLLLNSLAPIRHYYDFILIDISSSSNALISAGLRAASQLIVPCSAGNYSLQGIHNLKRFLNHLKQRTGHQIPNIMIAVTRTVESSRLPNIGSRISSRIGSHIGAQAGHRRPATTDTMEDILEHIFGKVFKIPDSMDILDAQLAKMPVSHFAPHSDASKSYAEMANQIIYNSMGRPAVRNENQHAIVHSAS